MARVLTTAFAAACFIAFGAMMLIDKLTTVRPFHAAVAGDTLPIRAPGGGVVTWIRPAGPVAPGDVVAAMSTYRSHESVAKLDQAIALGEQDLKSKTDAARDVRATFNAYRASSSVYVAMAKARARSVDEQVRLQTGRVARLATLSAGGFVSRDTMDAEESRLAGLKSQSFDSRRAVEEARLARVNAERGYYLDEGRATQASVRDAQREQAVAAAELQRLQSLRTASPPVERIEAPCRCTIVSQRVQRGEYVREGELLLSLNRQTAGDGRRTLRIEAVVPLDQVSKIDVGSRATALLPGAKGSYRGTVVRVAYDLTTASGGGLPKQVLEMGGVALVVVSVPYVAGMPALDNATPVRLKLHGGLASALGF